jgi:hypothetical protein
MINDFSDDLFLAFESAEARIAPDEFDDSDSSPAIFQSNQDDNDSHISLADLIDSAPAKTPVGNTGSKNDNYDIASKFAANGRFSVGIHWLNLSIKFQSFQKIFDAADYLTSVFNDVIIWDDDTAKPTKRGQHYQNSIRSGAGLILAWNNPKVENDIYQDGVCLLSIPGSLFDNISFKASLDLCKDMESKFDARPSMIHVALDDYAKALNYHDLVDAGQKKNMRYPTKLDPRPGIFDPNAGNNREGQWLGWSVTFGSSQSDSQIEFYDKESQSKGLIKAIRQEAKYSKGKAFGIFKKLCKIYTASESEELAANYLVSTVLGTLDFRDRSNGEILVKDCPLLDWWQDYIKASEAEPLRPKCIRHRTTLYKKLAWIKKDWAKTAAQFSHVMGQSGFSNLIDWLIGNGFERMKPIDYAIMMVADYDNNSYLNLDYQT